MNILVICHYGLYSDFSSSFVHKQACAFTNLGHNVRVLVPIAYGKRDWNGKRFNNDAVICEGVSIYSIRFISISSIGKKKFNTVHAINAIKNQTGAILENFHPDIICANTVGLDSDIGKWFKAKLQVPLAVIVHGSDVSRPFIKGNFAWLNEKTNGVDTVIAISSKLAEKVKKCNSQVPVEVVLNGFDISGLTDDNAKVPCSVIQVGHLQEQKRISTTIKAFSSFKLRHPEAKLTIVGQGNQYAKLVKLCKSLGIYDAVAFKGQIPNNQVLTEMGKSQFFCMPSVNEGFGIVYLEAMASGCLTIGTEGEGISDFITNRENGFLVPPDSPEAISDIWEECLSDPDRMSMIAANGKTKAIAQTWEKNATKCCSIFLKIMDGNKYRDQGI